MIPFLDKEIHSILSRLVEEKNFVFLETGRVTSENSFSYLFTNPIATLSCDIGSDVNSFLEKIESYRENGYYLAGWIGYEFGYLLEEKLFNLRPKNNSSSSPLAWFGVYKRPEKWCHVNLKSNEELSELDELQDRYSIEKLDTSITRECYIDAINRIKQYITSGDIYQANFTLQLEFIVQGSLQALYRSLRFNQSVSYSGWLRNNGRDIMSFSPELFFQHKEDTIRVRPMKGTSHRGRNEYEDQVLRNYLQQDCKNRAENVMIVDLLRNDISRLLHDTSGGEVCVDSLFDVETYESLLQMTSTITGTSFQRKNIEFSQIIKALFPCGSVTGAPKIRAMEIIHELEKEPRGVYTGAIGYLHGNETVFNVPIRTLVIENGRGTMGIGSGIVADSDADEEWKECLLKGDFLIRPRSDFQLIETLLWLPESGFFLLEGHLDRLMKSASYFLFSCDIELIREKLTALKVRFRDQGKPQRVRLLVFSDGRTDITTNTCNHHLAIDNLVPDCRTSLPVAKLSENKVDSSSPYLFHKTTRRDLYSSEREKALAKGFYEVFFTNERDEITEGSISNIVIKKDGLYLTPPVECGLLAGVLRGYLFEMLGQRIKQSVLSQEDVLSADEVYAVNSVRGMIQVDFTLEQGKL